MSASRPDAARATPSLPGRRAMPARPTSALSPTTTCPTELANAPDQWLVRQYPAVSSPPAASMNALTMAARSSGVAPAVAGSSGATGPTGAGGASPGQPGSSGATRAAATVRSTSACNPDSSATVDEPLTVRPSQWIVHVDAERVLGDVLVDHRVGEAGQRQAVAADRDLHLGGGFGDADELEGPLASPRSSTLTPSLRSPSASGLPSSQARRRSRPHSVHLRPPAYRARKLADAHARTPTRTLRKRAGAAGWPV